MVNVGTGTSGTRFINTNYPIDEGLEAGTEKQTGRTTNLLYEDSSKVLERDKAGI